MPAADSLGSISDKSYLVTAWWRKDAHLKRLPMPLQEPQKPIPKRLHLSHSLVEEVVHLKKIPLPLQELQEVL